MTDQELAEAVVNGLTEFKADDIVHHKDGRIAKVCRKGTSRSARSTMVQWQIEGELSAFSGRRKIGWGWPVWVRTYNLRLVAAAV